MAWLAWFSEHWFSALQTASIVGGLVFTGVSIRTDAKARRVQNLLTLTSSHREIWSQFLTNPKLSRILDPRSDLVVRPVTREEHVFLTFIILHLGSAYRAIREGVLPAPDGLTEDIRSFFSLPLPAAAWTRLQSRLDADYAIFVNQALSTADRKH